MSGARIIDPVCDMIVDVTEARDRGLTLEYPDREYAFCAAGCQSTFAKDPKAYVPKVEAWLAREGADAGSHAHDRPASEDPEIDAGVRAWYASCRCCLSDAYPRVVEVLDRERSDGNRAPADAGICETAEAQTARDANVNTSTPEPTQPSK
jgi:YHS domain-containing protein